MNNFLWGKRKVASAKRTVIVQLTLAQCKKFLMLLLLCCRCEIVDFHKPSGDNNTHPRLMQWVKDYFQEGQGKFLPPLYFQHQGKRALCSDTHFRD